MRDALRRLPFAIPLGDRAAGCECVEGGGQRLAQRRASRRFDRWSETGGRRAGIRGWTGIIRRFESRRCRSDPRDEAKRIVDRGLVVDVSFETGYSRAETCCSRPNAL